MMRIVPFLTDRLEHDRRDEGRQLIERGRRGIWRIRLLDV